MYEPDANGASISKSWYSYFLANRLDPHDMPWDDPYVLSPTERRAIGHSIQQFQLGEGAGGRRLQERGRAYSGSVADPHFSEALALFVKEEQRHSAHLLRFMRGQGIPALSSHWVDSVFRRLRVLAGLELSLRVLVTAEIIAVPYYRALGHATRAPLLRAISARILEDEIGHLKFESSMLSRLAAGRLRVWSRLVWRLHRIFLVTTSFVVWKEHGRVFRAAGYSFKEFVLEALVEFAELESPACRAPSDRLVASRPQS
jgi:hypothetical protein